MIELRDLVVQVLYPVSPTPVLLVGWLILRCRGTIDNRFIVCL
jgi:hypothetical protein